MIKSALTGVRIFDFYGRYKGLHNVLFIGFYTEFEEHPLNDSGIAFWNNEKVVNISVDGKTDFKSTDWYFPDVKVVISYH